MSLLETLEHPTPEVVGKTIYSLYGIRADLVRTSQDFPQDSDQRKQLKDEVKDVDEMMSNFVASAVVKADDSKKGEVLDAAKQAILIRQTGSESFCIEILSTVLIKIAKGAEKMIDRVIEVIDDGKDLGEGELER